jgi:tetraprenyl-beta-curcumene synthase
MLAKRQARCIAAVFDVAAALATLVLYWLRIVPQARHELRCWRNLAQAIPAAELRACALETLSGEAMNAEAAAVFAVLVPRRYRSPLTRLTVAFQVMYDYLDTVSERADSARASLQLHRALSAAFDIAEGDHDYYALYSVDDDGGYLAELVAECRVCIATLPAAAVVRPLARRAAARCAHAQSFTHVAFHDDARALKAWARNIVSHSDLDYHWWEVAAAGISSLAIHALFAAAAHSDLDLAGTMAIDAAYFPSVCALSTLLDSLIDAEEDAITGNHSYVSHYADSESAGSRLVAIVSEAVGRLDRLRGARLHRTIMAGVAAFYLSAAAARADAAIVVTQQVLAALSPSVLPILWTLGLRREAKLVGSRLRHLRTRRL